MSTPNEWSKLRALVIAIALSFTQAATCAEPQKGDIMKESASISYMSAFRYVAAWASFVNAPTTDLVRNPHDFYGTLGSLEFFYSDNDKTLRAWSFVMPAAGSLLTNRRAVKDSLDKIARDHPDEVANGTFDIRRLEWHKQAGPDMDPSLYVRLDIINDAMPVQQMVKVLNHLSTTGYIWHEQKMSQVLESYWKAHPKPPK